MRYRGIGLLLTLMTCSTFGWAQLSPLDKDATMPNWEAQARKRIEQHRKGDFVVRVLGSDGTPAAGVKVRAAMNRHAFVFGTAMSMPTLVEEGPESRYATAIVELFNQITPENYYKWSSQEKTDRIKIAAAATRWALEQGLSIHGHTMIWEIMKWKAMPKDVHAAVEDGTATAEWLRERSMEHIRKVGRRYAGNVVSWDVVNENHSEHALQDVIHPDTPPQEGPILVEWYKLASEVDPDARLFVNDFDILVINKKGHQRSYERLIRFLLDNGAPLGGIGFQSHAHNGYGPSDPQKLLSVLDDFAKYELPLKITEFDMFGKGWGENKEEKSKAQTDYFREFYITCFSHPAVTGITMWGFWDGRHWADNGPLFYKDWSPKPALAIYKDLVFHQWWTDEQGVTDENGEFRFRGFFGRYDIRLDERKSPFVESWLREDGATVEVQLR
jgi:GH35 family endo-1,4-beta-xylanase